MSPVGWVLGALGLYLGLGFAFAAPFHWAGLHRVDPGVTGSGVVFRLLITPGIVALWPLLALRWRRAAVLGRPVFGSVQAPLSARGLRAIHRGMTQALAVLVPLAFGSAVVLRPAAHSIDVPPALRLLPDEPVPSGNSLIGTIHEAPFPPLPITARLTGDTSGKRWIELSVEADLEIPAVFLYHAGDAGPFRPARAVLLGSVWGPGAFRFELPQASSGDGGLTLYSMAHQSIVGTFPLSALEPLRPRG